MATFLFLVGFAATTLLLLANALDEVLSAMRRVWRPFVTASELAGIEDHSNESAANNANAQSEHVPSQSKSIVQADDGWMPDRAA